MTAWAEDRAPWRHDPSIDPGAKTEGGRHDAALSFPFGIGTKAANRPHLFPCALYLISQPRFLHFTLNHYSLGRAGNPKLTHQYNVPSAAVAQAAPISEKLPRIFRLCGGLFIHVFITSSTRFCPNAIFSPVRFIRYPRARIRDEGVNPSLPVWLIFLCSAMSRACSIAAACNFLLTWSDGSFESARS